LTITKQFYGDDPDHDPGPALGDVIGITIRCVPKAVADVNFYQRKNN